VTKVEKTCEIDDDFEICLESLFLSLIFFILQSIYPFNFQNYYFDTKLYFLYFHVFYCKRTTR
jgi:hypothetical protein